MPDDSLKNLNEKLEKFRAEEQGHVPRDAAIEAQNMNNGARAGLELVSAILAGGAIGWGLDNWLHTRPWMMILFLFLGIATGFRSVYRITNNLGAPNGSAALQKARKTATKPPISDDEDQ